MAEYILPIGLREGPANFAGAMNIGDTIIILPLDGEGEIVYPVPAGFVSAPASVGFGFTAMTANMAYPYAQFQIAGYSGKQITISVAVYP